MSFSSDVTLLRQWVDTVPLDRRGEGWADDFPGWPSLWKSATQFLRDQPPSTWNESERRDLLFTIDLDYIGDIIYEILEEPDALLLLARSAVGTDHGTAKSEITVALREGNSRREEVLPILLEFVHDAHEIVRRQALISLSRLHAPQTEELAERAWDSGDEYQRCSALDALREIGSTKLNEYVHAALADGREFVVKAAERALAGIRW